MLNTGVRLGATIAASVVVLAGTAFDASAGPPAPPPGGPAAAKADKPEYPPFDKVVEDLEKVISTADGAAPLYDLYRDQETGRLLAALPGNYQDQLVMIACTISGGDPEAGDVWSFTTGSPECEYELGGDANNDCVVNLEDFAITAGNWLECNLINGNCP